MKKTFTTDIDAPPTCIIRSNFCTNNYDLPRNFYQDEECSGKPHLKEDNLLEKRGKEFAYLCWTILMLRLELHETVRCLCNTYIVFSLSSFINRGKNLPLFFGRFPVKFCELKDGKYRNEAHKLLRGGSTPLILAKQNLRYHIGFLLPAPPINSSS